jgi:coproporphyrinogen III oxidase-like Fe-S oxidoreductase
MPVGPPPTHRASESIYSSYPTAIQFDGRFVEAAYLYALELVAAGTAPMSIYTHLPYLQRVEAHL